MDKQTALEALGQDTRNDVAEALWLKSFDAAQLSPEILENLVSEKNSPRAFGERMQARLRDLIDNPTSFTPSYKKRYEAFLQHMEEMTPHQARAVSDLLGPDFDRGFEQIPDEVHLTFPKNHYVDLKSQVGWYYIVGCCTDVDGVEYGVLFMLYRVSLLPPDMAASFGLSDLENQVTDMQFMINRGADQHYQAVPICVAGTTGLLHYGINPFVASYGKNAMRSLSNEDMFPFQARAHGWDRGQNPPVEMQIEFEFSSGKGILLQGKNGVLSFGGIGTPYYSIPNMVLDPTKSRIILNGKAIALKEGQFWFDHQWGVLGVPRTEVLRAASNLMPAGPGGWDWFEMQFDGDRQITVVGMHNHDHIQYYFQDGPTPPGTMSIKVTGKYMDEHGTTMEATGVLNVTDWVKSDQTPDPTRYWSTTTWHPNRWEFEFDAPVSPELRNIILVPFNPKGSLAFWNAGQQYQEAPVHILNASGDKIGRGYAESVSYANTNKNRLELAGMPTTPEMLALLDTPEPSAFSRIWSALYTVTHRTELGHTAPEKTGTP